MEQSKIDRFIGEKSHFFPSKLLPLVKEQLEMLGDDKLHLVRDVEYKDPNRSFIVSLFLGRLGIDRFMLGQIVYGFFKFLTPFVGGIWTITDWFIIKNRTRRVNYVKFFEICKKNGVDIPIDEKNLNEVRNIDGVFFLLTAFIWCLLYAIIVEILH